MDDKKEPKFKSRVAIEAFSELCQIASMDRDRMLGDIDANKKHSEYERALLKINISQSYHDMISGAYQTAMNLEIGAQSLHANLYQVFKRE